MNILNTNDIQQKIPHRYQNLLIDQFSCPQPNEGTFQLTVNSNDSMGRNIFLKNMANESILQIPFLAEIGALASIVSSGEIKEGSYAYFAAITQFNLTDPNFKSNALIQGQVKRISEKKGFHKFNFDIASESGGKGSGQLLAYYDHSGPDTDSSNIDMIDIPNHIELSKQTKLKINPFTFKDPSMTLVNAIHPINLNDEYLLSYTYPSTHPLVNGHFPNNPVMMGVCQWLMIEDAVSHILEQVAVSSTDITVSLNATIFKDDNTPVCDLKSITLHAKKDATHWIVNTTSAKKILFKQKVVPGDLIYTHIHNFNITD